MIQDKNKRSCIYCGIFRPMSKEHIIANWIQRIIPQNPTFHAHSHIHVKRLDGLTAITPYFPKEEQGSLGSRQLRRVCSICNGGWMKDLQDNAKPIINPLILGNWANLNPASASIISSWCTMTVMNIDAADFRGAGVPQAERSKLEHTHLPPSNWSVWIGRCTGGDPYEVYHRPFKAHKRGTPLPKDQNRNSQITTIKIGQMLLHTTSFPPEFDKGNNFAYGNHFGIVPLFPAWGGDVLDWRYAPILDSIGVDKVANGFIHEMMGRKI